MFYNLETSKEENYYKFRQLAVHTFKTKYSIYDTEVANDLTTDLIIHLETSLKKSRTKNLDPEFCGKAAFYTFDRYMRTVKKEQGTNEDSDPVELLTLGSNSSNTGLKDFLKRSKNINFWFSGKDLTTKRKTLYVVKIQIKNVEAKIKVSEHGREVLTINDIVLEQLEEKIKTILKDFYFEEKKEEKVKEEVLEDSIDETITKSKRIGFEVLENEKAENNSIYYDSLDLYFIKRDIKRRLGENNEKVFDLVMQGYKLVEIVKLTNLSIDWVQELNKRNETFLKENKSRYL